MPHPRRLHRERERFQHGLRTEPAQPVEPPVEHELERHRERRHGEPQDERRAHLGRGNLAEENTCAWRSSRPSITTPAPSVASTAITLARMARDARHARRARRKRTSACGNPLAARIETRSERPRSDANNPKAQAEGRGQDFHLGQRENGGHRGGNSPATRVPTNRERRRASCGREARRNSAATRPPSRRRRSVRYGCGVASQ